MTLKVNCSDQKLLDENGRLRAIYQAIPIPTYTWKIIDGDFVLTDYNKAAANKVGEKIKKFVGTKASIMYREDPAILEDFDKCRDTKGAFGREMTYRYRTSDDHGTLDVKYAFVSPDIILVQTEDISQRRKLEADLNEKKKQLALFVEHSPAALAMVDTEMKYLITSNRWITDYNLTGRQIIGKCHYEIFPEIEQEWKDIHQRCLKGAIEKREEDSFVRLDGSTDWMRWEIRPWHTAANVIGGIIMFTEVITERKKAELAQKESELKYRYLFNNIPTFLIIWDLESLKVLEINDAVLVRYGYSKEEWADMCILRFRPEEDHEKIKDFAREVLHGSAPVHSRDWRHIKKCGEIMQMQIFSHRIIYNNRPAVLSVGVDITERIKGEFLLNEKNKRIEAQTQDLIIAKVKAEENESRLKLAAKSAKLGIWDWNVTSNVLTWDERMFELYGITDQGNHDNSKEWESGLHPQDRERVMQELKAAIRGGKNFDCSFRIIRPDASILQIKAEGLTLRDTNGHAHRMIGINRDITDKKYAEDALRDKELKYRTLFEASVDAVLLFFDGHCIDCNTSALKIFGCRKEQIIGVYPDSLSPLLQLDGKLSQEVFNYKIELAFAGEPQFFQWDCCRFDRTLFTAEVFLNRLDLAGQPYLQTIVRDISERKKAEEQLALSALIVNSSDDAIISKTIEGKITSWNAGAEKVLGYTSSEAIGQSIYLLVPSDLRAEEKMITDRIQSGRSVDHYETIRIRKDGRTINVSLTISPIMDASGRVMGASKIMRDVSAQKVIELERNKITDLLIQRNRDLEQFSYIVSHNLRAPLANIIGISDFMLSSEIEPEEKKKMNFGLSQSAHALDVVIKDLNHILQARQATTGHMTTVRLSEIIEEIKLSIADLIEKEQVTFLLDFSLVDHLMTIKSYLHSIFYNLITNSIKYRQTGVNPVIEIKSRLSEQGIELTLRDNGLGIDLKRRTDQIFGLYKRFHKNIEGKGMGLYLVKTQVEALGGKITVESEVNKGSKFKIEFKN